MMIDHGAAAAAVDPVHSGAQAGAGMSSLVLQAAQSAAAADGLSPSNAALVSNNNSNNNIRPNNNNNNNAAKSNNNKSNNNNNANSCLRRGKWTPEEEAYANRLIFEFKSGLLPLTDGTTLRTFLSKLLNCDPMRISKKFVGSNCIGKQVFRRRNADLSRLAPEQIQQSRAELSELERRFLERVSQTNRVKSSGVGGGGQQQANGNNNQHHHQAAMLHAAQGMDAGRNAATSNELLQNYAHELQQQQNSSNGYSNNLHHNNSNDPPTPPWLKPPMGYRHGQGQAFAQAHLSGNARAAAAGRAMLEGLSSSQLQSAVLGQRNKATGSTDFSDLFLQDLQQRASSQNLFGDGSSGANNNGGGNSNAAAAAGLFAAAAARRESLAQLAAAQNGLGGGHQQQRRLGSNPSLNNLMLKAGLSRDQLSQLARERGLSSGSLSHMMNRQNSFDALMSLDYQSLQSIDNLANLMQNSNNNQHYSHSSSQHHHPSHNNFPETGMKNADFGGVTSNSFAAAAASSGDLSSAARRLASAGRMESLLKNMSHGNMQRGGHGGGDGSSATLSNLLQSSGLNNLSAASLFNAAANSASAASLADLLRQDSSTGLSALRMQDGLNNRNSSVDDFLSLVAAGDIPHQDPSLLNVPLLHQQQQQAGGGNNNSVNAETAKFLAQHQHLLASSGMSNSALANALASRGNLANSLNSLQQAAGGGGSVDNKSAAAAAYVMAQARANDAKRKLEELSKDADQQDEASSKRSAV